MNVVLTVFVLVLTSVAGTLIGMAVGMWVYMDLLANSPTFVRWMKKWGERYVETLLSIEKEEDE